jgi:hypothetical protein
MEEMPESAKEIIADIFGEQNKKKAYMAVLAALDSQQQEIERLKELINDAYDVGYDASSFAHSSDL